ncbi:hypothetical protein RIF29_47156 [Crotalaria pallida]|uniref:Uncharacterized protein n=1 Tax=Crotalaria pallida TaxID=3830 RepID=A0AAN9HJ16_CROPI
MVGNSAASCKRNRPRESSDVSKAQPRGRSKSREKQSFRRKEIAEGKTPVTSDNQPNSDMALLDPAIIVAHSGIKLIEAEPTSKNTQDLHVSSPDCATDHNITDQLVGEGCTSPGVEHVEDRRHNSSPETIPSPEIGSERIENKIGHTMG